MIQTNICHFCKNLPLASTSVRSFTILTEDDGVPGSKFEKDPENYNVEQLRRWLKCRGLKQSGKREELSGEDKSAARVFNVNPRLNRTRQMNSFSRGVNSGSGPLFDLSESKDSPKFQ